MKLLRCSKQITTQAGWAATCRLRRWHKGTHQMDIPGGVKFGARYYLGDLAPGESVALGPLPPEISE
jgi:hypothetical protein